MTNILNEIEKNVEKGKKAIEEVVGDDENTGQQTTQEDKKTIKSKSKKSSINKSDKSSESEQIDEKTLVKAAEAESLDTSKTDKIKEKEEEKSLEERKKELLKKAKKLAEKVDVTKTEELKKQIKIKKRSDMLIPLEEYVKVGIYLGTKVVTPNMKPFVYRRRADGLAIFNTDLIDEKLKEGIEYLSKFDSEDIILVCKRQVGWRTANMFSELTGIKVFTKKYPAGILTNTELPDFFENKLTIITDSWLDKNALNDTLKINKKILMVCDTNNSSKGADQIIIGNNKSEKSLGIIFYLLARGYCKSKNIKSDIPKLEWWTGEDK